ncbi:DUF883 family protein [Cupriavidus necator]
MKEVTTVLSDAEQLLQQADRSSGEKSDALREHGMDLLKQARDDVRNLQEGVGGISKFADDIDAFLHKRPGCAIALAIAIGMLCGLLLAHRK